MLVKKARRLMVCSECADTLGVHEQYLESDLGNWDDTCMTCGKPASTREVTLRKKISKAEFIFS